ncbi:MAG: DnaA ATPase domain-containing protein, partial [Catenulispora sp.]
MPEDATVDLESLWAHAIDGLADSTVTPQQRAWLRTTRPLGLLDGTALLAAPNEFTKDVLETRLRPMITTALSQLLGREIRVAVTVEPPPAEDGAEPAIDDADQVAEDTQPGLTWPPSSAGTRAHTRIEPARLNPKYTFETFVIGSGNRFAHAAAVAVAEAPAKAYNPLFIYGDSGLGKTHLLHAIGHYAQRLFQNARVRYVSSEEFTNDFINSLRDDKQSAFQRRYRDNDVLLVDDIQFLENKERTQEEFFHTFNTLHNANKQIVISSD